MSLSTCVRQALRRQIVERAGGRCEYCRFFHPQIEEWGEHFSLSGPRIIALTDMAEVTIRIFRLNASNRVAERKLLQAIGAFSA